MSDATPAEKIASDLAVATFAVVARSEVSAIPCTFVVSAVCVESADAAVASASVRAVDVNPSTYALFVASPTFAGVARFVTM